MISERMKRTWGMALTKILGVTPWVSCWLHRAGMRLNCLGYYGGVWENFPPYKFTNMFCGINQGLD